MADPAPTVFIRVKGPDWYNSSVEINGKPVPVQSAYIDVTAMGARAILILDCFEAEVHGLAQRYVFAAPPDYVESVDKMAAANYAASSEKAADNG